MYDKIETFERNETNERSLNFKSTATAGEGIAPAQTVNNEDTDPSRPARTKNSYVSLLNADKPQKTSNRY